MSDDDMPPTETQQPQQAQQVGQAGQAGETTVDSDMAAAVPASRDSPVDPPVGLFADIAGLPNVARMIDYWLGGDANTAIDRGLAERVAGLLPMTRLARQHRAFVRRSVDFAVREVGVTQILDLGAGIPTVGAVHQFAAMSTPTHHTGVNVVYVDIDQVAVEHWRGVLGDDPRTRPVQGDVRCPGDILASATQTGLIDRTRPVAVLATSVLHFLGDHDRPGDLLREYLNFFPAGSCVALSHLSLDGLDEDTLATVEKAVALIQHQTRHVLVTRHPDAIQDWLTGLTLAPPGLAPLSAWTPDHILAVPGDALRPLLLGALAVTPAARRPAPRGQIGGSP